MGLVRTKFDALGARLGRRYEISVASPAGIDKIATFNLPGMAPHVYNSAKGLSSSFETPTSIAQKSQWVDELGLGGMMFWDITNDALDSQESLINAGYASWVLDADLATIRGRSQLTNELIVGGDGRITPLPTLS